MKFSHCNSNNGHRLRLKKKLVEGDAKNLYDYEILELLLFAAQPRRDVKPLAKKLISEFGGFKNVIYAKPDVLEKIVGISKNTIAIIKTVAESINRIFQNDIASEKYKISDTNSIVRYLRIKNINLMVEKAWLFLLDPMFYIIKIHEFESVNSHSKSFIDVKYIMQIALKNESPNIIIAHNHPNGNPNPSDMDIKSTIELKNALQKIDLKLIDHIIISGERHSSLKAMHII